MLLPVFLPLCSEQQWHASDSALIVQSGIWGRHFDFWADCVWDPDCYIRAQYSPCDQEERRSPDYLSCVRVTCGTCLSRDYSNSSQMPACEVHLGLPPLQRGNTHRVGGKPRFPTRSFDGELAFHDKWRRESGILSLTLHGAVGVGQVPLSSCTSTIMVYGLCYNFSVLINTFLESIKAELFGAKNLCQQLSSLGHFCGFANPVGSFGLKGQDHNKGSGWHWRALVTSGQMEEALGKAS